MAAASAGVKVASDAFPRPFGKYLLLAPLAQGGMGSLFLACQGEPGMEKLCVVKTVLPALADKEYVARFRDEAKVVVRLSHGNLVPVFDAGQVEGELYVAMDFVDGKDLRGVWNRCAKKGIAFPVDVAVHIVRELARGLHHAHTDGNLRLVHRDVSPPNVLLAFSGEVKLTDFGLASSVLKLEKTAPGVIYGKVSYMAPEQARGEELDGRTDQYAAAVILWELLTGRQLFPASDADVLAKVRSPRIDAPSKRAARVPARLDAVVMKALAPERGDRYADCEAFRVALAEFLAREAPATDAARVAGFLRELFDDEIAVERARRQALVERAQSLPRPERRRDRRESAAGSAVAAVMARSAAGALDVDTAGLADTAAGAGAAAGRPPVGALPPSQRGAEREPAGETELAGVVIGGRYRIVRLVGEGGMGRVYEAEHVEIGKRVAVKLLHPHYGRLPDLVARFRREARAASRIGHPNIVDVTDSGTTDDGDVFFVMEFLDGVDLSAVIEREQSLAVERAVAIAIQLSRALEAAHRAGIVHRDLKPENVFLVPRAGQPDFVKVLDFGIARNLDEGVREGRLTDPGIAMGTPEYMAPEQASGQATDARADIYAVGAILYEMLSGRPPHEGRNLMEVLTRKAGGPPPSLVGQRADVGELLGAVVARALATDPAARQQTMAELATELERCRPDRRSGRRRAVTAEGVAMARGPGAASPARGVAAGGGGAVGRVATPVDWVPGDGAGARGDATTRDDSTVEEYGGAAAPGHAGRSAAARPRGQGGEAAGSASSRADWRSPPGASAPTSAPVEVPRSRGALWLRAGLVGAGALLSAGATFALLRGSPSDAPARAPARRDAAPHRAESRYAAGSSNAAHHSAPPAASSSSTRASSPSPAGSPPARTPGATTPFRPSGAASAPAPSSTPSRSVPAGGSAHPGGHAASPPPAELRRQLDEARQLVKAGQLDAAEDGFQRAFEAGADPGIALTGLAEVALRRGHVAEAIRRGDRAVRRSGGVGAHLVLGEAYTRQHDYEGAAHEYREVLRLEPEHAQAQRRLAAAERKVTGG